MIDIAQGIDSLTKFKRDSSSFLKRMKRTGRPIVLTVNGKAEVIVQDAAAYQRLLDMIDRLEAIEGIKRGLKDAEQGRTTPIEQLIGQRKKRNGV